MKEMKILKKKKQGTRVLLFGADPSYHLIANPEDKVEIGDTVAYEPFGLNFGWFIRVISR